MQNPTVAQLQRRLSPIDARQVQAWRAMSGAQRLEIAFQAYRFTLNIVRLTERKRAPDLSPEEFDWRVTRRMQGNQKLGREYDDTDIC